MGVLAGTMASGAVTPKAGTTLTVSNPINSNPGSNFPFYSAGQCTTTNIDYWNLEVRPGYWFGLGGSVSLQPALSTLNPAHFTKVGANTRMDFTVKGWNWSNGTSTRKMTAQDVAFFMNMDKAQSKQGLNSFCGDAPGFGIPDQVVSSTYPGGLNGNSVRIVMKGHASQLWLIYNELSQIVPMTTAWDTTGGGPAGCSTENFNTVKTDGTDTCSSVFNYLSGLQMDNALWSWSDGPYRQTQAQYSGGIPDGNNVQIANADYSGPVKAHAVKTIVYQPYKTIDAERSALQAPGSPLDFGFLDTTDVSKAHGLTCGHIVQSHLTAYALKCGVTFGIFYWQFNFDNSKSTYHTSGKEPGWARLNNNPYFRQALQSAENQQAVINTYDNGYAVPTFSAIPTYPKNAFNKGLTNPYPYSKTTGRDLMADNGWNVKVFPAVCAKSNCAAPGHPSIAKGTKATEQVLVPGGITSVEKATQSEIASIKAGSDIQITVKFEKANDVQAACFQGLKPWELCGYGGWIYAPDYYPSGEVLFAAGSGSNAGGYVSGEMNALIAATTTNGNLALNAKDAKYKTSFAEFTATDIPYLWQPTPTTFGVQAKSVVGAQAPNPLGNFNPEYITTI
jgi:peptide/nickel transport system substrate-binding protein